MTHTLRVDGGNVNGHDVHDGGLGTRRAQWLHQATATGQVEAAERTRCGLGHFRERRRLQRATVADKDCASDTAILNEPIHQNSSSRVRPRQLCSHSNGDARSEDSNGGRRRGQISQENLIFPSIFLHAPHSRVSSSHTHCCCCCSECYAVRDYVKSMSSSAKAAAVALSIVIR